jgi:hypothetical protein
MKLIYSADIYNDQELMDLEQEENINRDTLEKFARVKVKAHIEEQLQSF